MKNKKKIFAISGSTRNDSSNFKILKLISKLTMDKFEIKIFEGLSEIPHYNPDFDTENPPKKVTDFRNEISEADGILICTPEYIFSLPGSLKNAFEWCVSTTVFSNKQVGLITASASGVKAHEELALIMKTLEAKFNDETELIIQGVRGKVDEIGNITNNEALNNITNFINSFEEQLNLN